MSRVDLHRHSPAGHIAVAIHDVEPATFERCALIRDWLADHGIDRATLLVVPAPDLHPFFQRRPELAAWLLDCRDRGDAIAQHGFQHRPKAEFARMDADDTHASIDAGRRMLRLVGRERASLAPALSLRRSPLGVRAGALAAGRLLRLDLHPADFDRPRHVLAFESVLAHANRRTPVTYDDLC